jgi:hypothetical protein
MEVPEPEDALRTDVGSVACSLAVLISPPPEIVTVLVTLAGAVADTFTVKCDRVVA